MGEAGGHTVRMLVTLSRGPYGKEELRPPAKQPRVLSTLEAGPPAPVKPSDDAPPSASSLHSPEGALSKNHTAQLLLKS